MKNREEILNKYVALLSSTTRPFSEVNNLLVDMFNEIDQLHYDQISKLEESEEHQEGGIPVSDLFNKENLIGLPF